MNVELLTKGVRSPEIQLKLGSQRRHVRLPSLRLWVSERRLLLATVDLLTVNAALLIALALRTELTTSAATALGMAKWYITLSVVWLLCAVFFDCYDLVRAASTFYGPRSSSLAAMATVLAYTAIPWLTPPLYSRSLIFVFCGLAVAGAAGWRTIYAQLFVQPWFKQRALVVGAGRAGRHLAAAIRTPEGERNPFHGTGYQLLGFVDDNPTYHGTTIEGLPVLGGVEALVSSVQTLQIDEVILAVSRHHAISDELFDALLHCRELDMRVTTMSALYERLLGRMPVEHLERDLHLVVPAEEAASERLYGIAKRALDLLLVPFGLLALGLLMPFVALANALTSPGPLFYRQWRVGKGGRNFEMLKFRSMVPNAEQESGAVWALDRDPRITPVGRLLRCSRLDELPQFINVLRGEMSVVGPRPERPEFVESLAHTIPFYRARHAVRPGLTGWAQVRYHYCSSTLDAQVRLEYDLYYIKRRSPFLDLSILLQTIPVMLRLEGY